MAKCTNDQCVVVGAHAFVLKVSSFFGMAPLRFTPHRNGCIVSISNPMCIYSYVLMTALIIITFYGIISELNLGINPHLHMSSRLSQVMSCCDISMLALLGGTGVYGSRCRMRNFIKLMRSVTSVDANINIEYSHTKERRLCYGFLIFMFLLTVMLVNDICFTTLQDNDENRQWDLILHYFGFYFFWYFVTMLELQFTFTAMTVNARFKAVNKTLSRITEQFSKPYTTGDPQLLTSLSDALQRVASLRSTLYDVVRHLENSFSLSLVIILVSTIFHLIITPYFALLEINKYMQSGRFFNFAILQCMWYSLHLLRLIMVVEPCHYTTVEGNKTENLICRMMAVSPNKGALASHLELFSRQLMLQTICYKPMGLCILGRPLITSIFGAVTTYLVILIQFQKYET